MKKSLAILALALLLAPVAEARIARSQAARHAFVKANACPATGLHRLPCKNAVSAFVIDHHVALCVGGADKPENMRWMTVADAKQKDKWECRPGWQDKLKGVK